ncbi:hypothetical protein JCM19239_5305 [Vibrio variabilis]|uniref:Uncharacterized protein n=1 Tax=Vibrio variabilis TaxID=990271 RepID=A0ABQ0JNQ7_9VIBR|nr:hypothetical protein JCM19239_5305 [Vibrio variabilis]
MVCLKQLNVHQVVLMSLFGIVLTGLQAKQMHLLRYSFQQTL